jgi:hypothetical protein
MIVLHLRVPAAMVGRLDARAKEMQAQHPGVTLSRSDVARVLLERGLS